MENNTPDNDQKISVLDCDNLEPCDIVLSSEKKIISKIIRVATKSKYSHARLYVGKSLIHATQSGVFAENPQRLHFPRSANVAVLRLKQQLTPDAIAAIIMFARSQVGALYSIPEAIRALKEQNLTPSNKQFCSRLVAQAYMAAGIQVVSTPNYCSPADISNSELFYKIDNYLRPPNEDDIQVSLKPNPIETNQKAYYKWMNIARNIAFKERFEIATEQDVVEFSKRYPKHCDKITKFIHSSGYLDNYKLDNELNPYRFSVQQCRERLQINRYAAEHLFEHDIQQEVDAIERALGNFSSYAQEEQNSFIKTMQQLYENLIDNSLKKLDVFRQALQEEGESELVKLLVQYTFEKHTQKKAIKNYINFGYIP